MCITYIMILYIYIRNGQDATSYLTTKQNVLRAPVIQDSDKDVANVETLVRTLI